MNQSVNNRLPQSVQDFLTKLLGVDAVSRMKVKELKSAQQRVWLLEDVHCSRDYSVPSKWNRALQTGNQRLIARQWKASCCWWNLNRNQQHPEDDGCCSSSGLPQNHQVEIMARSEIAGYRIAGQALHAIRIPDVLHLSLDHHENEDVTSQEDPWAILAYVGPDSKLFDKERKPDLTWLDGMVKIRFEFGFNEPHPRWGRVPEDRCMEYTLSVLKHVTMPLHRHFRDHQGKLEEYIKALRRPPGMGNVGFTYSFMVRLYREEQQKMRRCLLESESKDNKLRAAAELLGNAIDKLMEQQPYSDNPLRPLVVHMDLQPQNLLFAMQQSSESGEGVNPSISSVFDWEEAALADPRFELLMLCRKVCSNRDQAEHIWKTYEHELEGEENLGLLEPWLALETVHSITSLLLQSMDLLGGGRSPWESKPDLWGKIQREIRRLVVEYSWDFCDIPEFH